MAGLTWILVLLCVAGGHLSPGSPVFLSALVVQAGQNVSLTCNLTSSTEITWYRLRSDQLLPLLTVTSTRWQKHVVNFHTADGRLSDEGDLQSGPVGLEVREVREEDAGLYFCTGQCAGAVCVDRGIHLAVDGVDRDPARPPCWTLGICVLPALLLLCVIFSGGVYLCSGQPAACCCHSLRGNRSLRVTEDDALHYSSLNLAGRPRPPGHAATGLVAEDVTYSTVASGRKSAGLQERR